MKIRTICLPIIANLGLISLSHAATITNNIIGVGPKSAPINPYVCIQGKSDYALKSGEHVDANQLSGNDYYVGTTIRFGGCTTSDTYLGYLGLNVNAMHNNSIASYNPPLGVHIKLANPKIDGNGNLTGQIEYTPIQANTNLIPFQLKPNANWNFVGINLSGLEFSKVLDATVVPNLSEEDAGQPASDLKEVQAFLKAGMNTIRVPISWGFLQLAGPGKGELNLEYFNSYIKPLLETLTKAGVNTIVDLHAYMRYSEFGKEYSGCSNDPKAKCPDGTMILDPKVYQDVWLKLYSLIKADPKINMNYILFDLMNEPVDVPDDLVFTIQTEIIKTLRQNGFQGNILVEGNSWSGLHSWTTATWPSRDGRTNYSNATLFTHDHFIKAGVTDLSNIIINVHQYLDQNYSGTSDDCDATLNSTGPNGFNKDEFVRWLKENHMKAIVTEFGAGKNANSCQPKVKQFLTYLQDNAVKDKDYGFVGWTIWSAGHGWGGYNLRVTPESYQMNVMKEFLQGN